MAKQITMKHDVGITKNAYNGWSWTVFLFGFWPPLFRGDFKWFGIGFLVAVVNMIAIQFVIGIVTTFIWWFYFASKYNEWHKNDLLLAGFKEI